MYSIICGYIVCRLFLSESCRAAGTHDVRQVCSKDFRFYLKLESEHGRNRWYCRVVVPRQEGRGGRDGDDGDHDQHVVYQGVGQALRRFVPLCSVRRG